MKSKQPIEVKKETRIGCAIALIALPFVLFFWLCNGDEEPVKETYTKSDALVDSYEYVRAQLKSPSSADFGYDANAAVTQIDDSTFAVHNIVDSQNGFGAMIRSNYTCKIIHHSNNTTECVGLGILSR